MSPLLSLRDCLSPVRCRLLLAAIVVVIFALRLEYLLVQCPVDLSGDEAQYWDWSRRLGLCYYSKGPVIAYIIRASCAIFGDHMWAVRLPALSINAATTLVTYHCTWRIFKSEKLAIGAVVLSQLMPIIIAGGYLMTIDAPLYLCWALATELLFLALFERRRWTWPILGIVIGIGSLTKYAMLLYLPIMCGALLSDEQGRRMLRTAGPWIATAIALACLTPAVVWNQQHGWVTLKHVARQTGASGGRLADGNTLDTIVGQFGAVGPTIAVLMIGGILCAFRTKDSRAKFLANMAIGFLAFNLLASFVAKVQQNWPAPAYFSLVILAAWWVAGGGEGEKSVPSGQPISGRRMLAYGSAVIGVVTMTVARDPSMLYPIAAPFLKKDLAAVDLLSRLRGWRDCGEQVGEMRATLPPGAFVLCDDYQQTAEMAFYVDGQPITYCAGPYFGKRLSQYDMWPDHRLDRTSPLVGRDAIYLGKGGALPDEITEGFASIERLPDLAIIVRGVVVKTFKTWRCRNFHGFDAIGSARPNDPF